MSTSCRYITRVSETEQWSVYSSPIGLHLPTVSGNAAVGLSREFMGPRMVAHTVSRAFARKIPSSIPAGSTDQTHCLVER